MTNEAKTTVLAFIDALNKEDFKAAKAQVNDDLTFIGVMGTRNGADAYFADMEKMKLKYAVKNAIAEGAEVCLQYDINMGGGVSIFAIGWYSLVQGKISAFKVVFDPRALLEKAGR